MSIKVMVKSGGDVLTSFYVDPTTAEKFRAWALETDPQAEVKVSQVEDAAVGQGMEYTSYTQGAAEAARLFAAECDG